MAGQFQQDVIGTPFSGVASKNGAMVVSESPVMGKRQSRKGIDDTNPEEVYEKLTGRFDDPGYY